MKKFFTIASCLMLSFFFSAIAGAQPKGDSSGPMHKGPMGRCPMGHFKMMDTNKDGKISQKEWEDFHAKMFKDMDKNGDGVLTADEMKPPMGGKMQPKE